jgi:phage terminase small subunit
VLIPAEVLTPADAGLMALTCRTYAYMKRLQRQCDKQKTVVYEVGGSKGQKVERRRKEFDLLDQAEIKYFRLLQEFGLTPVSRNRVKTAKPSDEDSSVAEFFG